MNPSSRTSKSIKNSIISLIFYFVNLIIQFFARKIFLEYLGTEILGLNSTATNLLQFLNLAELGISTAVGFCLYKPLYDNDYNSVNEIVKLQGIIYQRIAVAILIGAFIMMLFFPSIFSKIELPLWYAYASFGVLLYGSLLGYFVNYKQVVLSASQQDYRIHYSFKTINILKSVFQMIAVWHFKHGYIWWLIIEGVFSTLAAFSLHWMTIKTFPILNQKVELSFSVLKSKYPTLTKKIAQLFFHRIGGFALTQSSPLIIYAFSNLTLVALYGNYLLITQGVDMLSRAVFNSINAGIGNLVAEGDKDKIKRLFDELFSLRFLLVTCICVGVYYLTPPFVVLWIGKCYILENTTLILMVAMLYIQLFRLAAESFSYAYGLYGDILAPVAEAILNIGLSVLGGYYYGLNGILSGAIISQIIIVVIWKPYYLFHAKMKGLGTHYILLYLKHVGIFGITIIIYHFLIDKLQFNLSSNWINFFCGIMIYMSLFAFLMITMLLIFKTPFISVVNRLKGIK